MHQPYHRRYRRLALLLTGALLLLPACARDQPQEEPAPAFTERPETRQDTVLVEGMPELTTAQLLVARDLDPPFSTYVPEGIAAGREAVGDSGAVRFSAAFTGQADPNAYMHVRLYPRDSNLLAAREVVAGFLRSRQPEDNPVDGMGLDDSRTVEAPSWGVERHRFDYEGEGGSRYTGHITLAQHGPRFFHVLVHYPAEYGDGLGPRFDYILRHWRWEDTGEPLQR
jgi:hypothetical protein